MGCNSCLTNDNEEVSILNGQMADLDLLMKVEIAILILFNKFYCIIPYF
jgi:hypothetical protein